MRRFLLALLACLCVLSLGGRVIKRGPHNPQNGTFAPVYNVKTDFGAVADAVEATGCDAGEDVPMNCTTAGTGTDDSAAFQDAINAAEVSGGTVFIPCGKYRIGAAGDGTWAAAAVVQADNVTVQGEGECSVLLPNATDGSVVIAACQNTATACGSPTQIENVHFRDFVIRDDDPFKHGCAGCAVLAVSSIGGEFLYMEPLTITGGGGETANFYWQSATADSGVIIVTSLSGVAGSLSDETTITGDDTTFTATIDSVTTDRESEESHGIYLANCRGCSIENVRFDYIGDEAVVVNKASEHALIDNNVFFQVPSTPSCGSSVDTDQSSFTTITNNGITLGAACGLDGNNVGFDVSSIDGDVTDVVIANNIIEEDDDALNNHSSAESGIGIGASDNNDIIRVAIQGNSIDIDIDESGTCDDTPGTVCDDDTDCVNSATDHCENHNRGCAGSTLTCESIRVVEASAQTGTINGLTIDANPIKGRLRVISTGTSGSTIISNNPVIGTHEHGISINGDSLVLDSNTFTGHSRNGIHLGVDSNEVAVIGNTITATGGLVLAGASIFAFNSTITSLLISGNIIDGAANGANYRGIDCGKVVKSRASENIITTADDVGIIGCTNVSGNDVYDAGGAGIAQNSSNNNYGVISGNTVDSAGAVCISVLGTMLGPKISGNIIRDCGSTAITDAATVPYTICENNTSITTDLIDVAPVVDTVAALGVCGGGGGADGDIRGVNDANSATDCTVGGVGTSHWCECATDTWVDLVDVPVVGEAISWNGAAEDGIVGVVSIDTSISIIPDSFAADAPAGADDVTDGTWVLKAVTISDAGAAAKDIVCDSQGFTETGTIRIPAP